MQKSKDSLKDCLENVNNDRNIVMRISGFDDDWTLLLLVRGVFLNVFLSILHAGVHSLLTECEIVYKMNTHVNRGIQSPD